MYKRQVSILPPLIRERLRLGPAYDLSGADRLMLRLMGAVAERRVDPASAPCQASVRLGLPANFLYRSLTEQARLLEQAGLGETAIAQAA